MNWRNRCDQGAFTTPKLQIGGILLICIAQDDRQTMLSGMDYQNAKQEHFKAVCNPSPAVMTI